MELDVFHLFEWEPIAFEDTFYELNRVSLLMLVAAVLGTLLFALGARKKRIVPKGLQNVVETGYLFVKNNIAVDVIGPQGTKFMWYLGPLFFFIFFSNFLEIVPGINFPVTSRMAIPAFLAVATWVVFNFVGFKNHGFGYLKDTLFPPGVPLIIKPLLALIELVSVFFIRPLTLAIRLFANMMAGHVLLSVFFLFTHNLITGSSPAGWGLSVITLAVACLLIVFELMVITIQAYIFTTLSAFYIAEAMHGHGDDHEHEVEAPPATPALRETELQPA